MGGGPAHFLVRMTRRADGGTGKVRDAPTVDVEGFLGLTSRPHGIAVLPVVQHAARTGRSFGLMIVSDDRLRRVGSVRLENRCRSGADLDTHPSARLVT